jgi:hypothetical protein
VIVDQDDSYVPILHGKDDKPGLRCLRL